MLVRLWRKGNPSALLVEMWTGAATVENIMEFPQKTKIGTAFLKFYFYFLLLFKYSFLDFPRLSPPPTLDPTCPLALSMCPLYVFLGDPSSFSPHYPLPPPLWFLSVCSLFQCLWLYFACLLVFFIRFHL